TSLMSCSWVIGRVSGWSIRFTMRSLESSTVGLTYFSPEPDDSVNDGTSLNADSSSNIGCEEFSDGGNLEYDPVSNSTKSSESSYRKTWIAADELVSVR